MKGSSITYPNNLIFISDLENDHHDSRLLFGRESEVKNKSIHSLLIARSGDEYSKLIELNPNKIGIAVIGQAFLIKKLQQKNGMNFLNFIPSFQRYHKQKFPIIAYGTGIIKEKEQLMREQKIIDWYYADTLKAREIVANCLTEEIKPLPVKPKPKEKSDNIFYENDPYIARIPIA